MKIVDVRAIPVRVPLQREFKAAYGRRRTADFVLVEVETDEGLVGVGEASPIPIYDQGSVASTVYALRNILRPLLLGTDPFCVGSIHHLMDRALKGERYAKSAIDFCLYDIMGKTLGVPVYQLIGGFQRQPEVTWVFSAETGEELAAEAREKRAAGFRVFKLKVGVGLERDLANLEAVRREIGQETELRLDGNGAWTPKEAVKYITAFLPYKPSLIEQPVPAWDLDGLAYVREKAPVPVVADECVLTIQDAGLIFRRQAADAVNIKVSRAGGIYPSLKMAAVAEASGVPVIAGSMLELGVGTVASAHWVVAVSGVFSASELIGPLLLAKDVLKEPLVYRSGILQLPAGPGFGIELDWQAVNEFRYNTADW